MASDHVPVSERIEAALRANAAYADSFARSGLPVAPAGRLAVVACMDARIDVAQMLGLDLGDAHVIRNAGGIVTDDVLRSLIASHHLGGTEGVIVVNHTKCAVLTSREDLEARLSAETGVEPGIPVRVEVSPDPGENVRAQMSRVRSHPWIPGSVVVRGFVYDVDTGRLDEVDA
ncbi:MAG TPA: carbonic anhydrase [Actinomycetota bacterium]|nr:carbonic anhydrase [Actinomycetota bacterium]